MINPCYSNNNGNSDLAGLVGILLPDEPHHFCQTVAHFTLNIGVSAAWKKRHLTWSFAGALPGLTREQTIAEFAAAVDAWAKVTPLTFTQVSAAGDIVAGLQNIDGPGKVLAWSELPRGSDAPLRQAYDSGDRFAPGMARAVICHEIGHALGLPHAPEGSPALMAPVYVPGRQAPLPYDIEQIQKLYGKPTAPTPPPGDKPVGPGSKIVIEITNADLIVIPGFRLVKE